MLVYFRKSCLHSKLNNSLYFCQKPAVSIVCLTKCPTPRCHRRPNSGCLFSQHFFVVKTKWGEIDYFPGCQLQCARSLVLQRMFSRYFWELGSFPRMGKTARLLCQKCKILFFKFRFFIMVIKAHKNSLFWCFLPLITAVL